MVPPCTAAQPEALSIELDQEALEAAAEIWALIEVAEMVPASADTRRGLEAARGALQVRLGLLGLDEEELRRHLMAGFDRGEPPGFDRVPRLPE